MEEKIKEILAELNDDRVRRRQEFIAFSEVEKSIVVEAEKITGLPKATTIAVACKYMLMDWEKMMGEEKEKNGKDSKNI